MLKCKVLLPSTPTSSDNFGYLEAAVWFSDNLNVFIVSVVRWDPRRERLIGYVYKGLGRGDGQLHPHANGPPVPHQWHGAQRQHPGLRQCRLHCQDLGYQDWPVPPNTARWGKWSMNSVRVTGKLLENQRLSQLLLKSNYILMTGLTFHDYISHFSESIMLAKLRVVVAAMEVSRTTHGQNTL